jgi:glycine/D-amino acid oxidase-like deaminating enzyme
MRVAVVGTGIVGACVGQALARRGAQVMMIDAGEPGAGVTKWSFSWVNASNKTHTRSYFDLNVAGTAAYEDLVLELGSSEWWHQTGHLRWCDDDRAAHQLLSAVELQRSWGYEAELWSARRVRDQLEPEVLFPRHDLPVAWYPKEGWVDGPLLVRMLVSDAVRLGATTHFGCKATEIATQRGHVTGITLADGSRHAVDAVVNASGPAGAHVAGLVGRTLAMRDEPGLVARVACRDMPIRRAMHSPHVELRPDGQSRLVLHSREIDALISAEPDTPDLADRLLTLARAAVPVLRTATLNEARIAWRPIPIDGFPSVGSVTRPLGYFEAVTHSGITLGAILGRLLAAEILDGSVHPLVEPYRPIRFE